MSAISTKLLTLITSKDLSYGELSKTTGIPKSALQRYATGKTEKIPLDRIKLLSLALNVTSAYLMGWEDNPSMQSLNEQKNTHLSEAERRVLELTHEHPELANMLAEITEIITNFSDEKLDAFLVFLKTMNNPE